MPEFQEGNGGMAEKIMNEIGEEVSHDKDAGIAEDQEPAANGFPLLEHR
jgi:hypothetical protein